MDIAERAALAGCSVASAEKQTICCARAALRMLVGDCLACASAGPSRYRDRSRLPITILEADVSVRTHDLVVTGADCVLPSHRTPAS